MLAERIREFIERPYDGDSDEFERLAEKALAQTPTSGTVAKIDSDLYRTAVEAALDIFLPSPRHPVLALAPAVPVDNEKDHSSHGSRLIDSLLDRGGPESLRACGPRGLEFAGIRSWLAARQRDRKPSIVVTSSETPTRLADLLQRRDLKFRLPAGSTLLHVLGRASEAPSLDVRKSLSTYLGVGDQELAAVYAPAGVATPFATRASSRWVFAPPPWTRVRITDPNGAEVAADSEGQVVLFDLANLGSDLEIATGDKGIAEPRGFRLLAPELA